MIERRRAAVWRIPTVGLKRGRIGSAGRILALALVSASSPSPHVDRAAMFRGGPALAGVYDAPSATALAGIRFRFHTGGPIRTTPAVANGVLYLGSSDHFLYAVDALTGRERWRLDCGAPVVSSPAVADGLVFVTNRTGRLFAVSRIGGTVKWSARLGADLGSRNYWDFYMSSATIADADLFIGSGDGRVRDFRASDGKLRWSYDAGSRVRSTPAVSGNHVVFGTQDGRVVALDRSTGARQWTFSTQGATSTFARKNNDTTSIYASATIANGVVVIGGRDGQAYGLDLASGRQLWRITHDGSSWILSSAADRDVAYIGSGSAAILQAVDLATGRERWRFAIKGAMFGSPTIAGDTILAGDFGGNLYAIDKDGHELWRFPLGERAFSTPVVAGHIVYAGSDEGDLYALDVSSSARQEQTPPKRYVYWEAPRDADHFTWFQNNTDRAVQGHFELADYQDVDAAGLVAAMQNQITDGGRSVIVFAADRVPAAALGNGDATALLRRYLEAGGHAVFLGRDPTLFAYSPNGDLIDDHGGHAQGVLGLRYPSPEEEKGYHVSTPTREGRRWGLDGDQVVNGGIDPSQVTTVLALNEFGKATSWVRSYGNRGGSLLQLSAPTLFVRSLTAIHMAVEHLLSSPPPGPSHGRQDHAPARSGNVLSSPR